MDEISIRQLRSLVAVRRNGSLSAAARELGLTQPAVSAHMKSLRSLLGVDLIRLRAKQAELNEGGAELASRAERILALLEQALTSARSRAQEGGVVRVAASSTPGIYLVPSIVAEFRKHRPETEVLLHVANTAAVEEKLCRGEADIGVVGGRLTSAELVAEPWRDDQLVLIMSPGHRLARQRRVPARDLAGERLLAREEGSATRVTYEAAFLRAGIPLPLQHEVGNVEAIKEAVAAAIGVAIVSRFAIRNELRSGKLRAVSVAGLPLRRPLQLLQLRDSIETPRVTALLSWLRRKRV